jgi:hypothetical protein
MYIVPIYQLGRSDVVLTGETLMNAGLPGKQTSFIVFNTTLVIVFHHSFSEILYTG